MKKLFIFFLVTITCQFCAINLFAPSVAINTDASTAHGSAILDIKSINKGMLPPRMTTAQRTANCHFCCGFLHLKKMPPSEVTLFISNI